MLKPENLKRIHALKMAGRTPREVAFELEFDLKTIKRYWDMDPNTKLVHGRTGVSRLEPFRADIVAYLENNPKNCVRLYEWLVAEKQCDVKLRQVQYYVKNLLSQMPHLDPRSKAYQGSRA